MVYSVLAELSKVQLQNAHDASRLLSVADPQGRCDQAWFRMTIIVGLKISGPR